MNNGAKALITTLTNLGVDTCFTNPGTSEMHFVAALDGSKMRAVLTLFEGVATGAADGYARMANKPAATLLHLGCGLGNGLANLHNARKARVPMINIIGDHATYHKQYDTPLESDIETVARNISSWVRTCPSTEKLGAYTAEAVSVAQNAPVQISTLILPADVSWGEGGETVDKMQITKVELAPEILIKQLADVLLQNGKKTALLLGRRVLLEEGIVAAAKIAEKTGATLYSEVFPARLTRGAGIPKVDRLAYLPEMAEVQLRNFDHLIIIDSSDPVSFFAYPGKKSYLVPDKCTAYNFITPGQDALGSLEALVSAVGARDVKPKLQTEDRPKLPSGTLSAAKVCQAVGALMPKDVVLSDEAQTSGVQLPVYTSGAPRHDILTLTGGAIGLGIPLAIGASIAAKNRPVIALVGDGSAMYTIQSLWTIMKENLDITIIIMNNRSYAILNIELERVGVDSVGQKAKSQLDLSQPEIDFVSLAKGMGMPAVTAKTAEEFNEALIKAINEPGPHLIDAIVPNDYKGLKLKALPYLLNVMDKIPSPIAKAIKKKFSP